MPQVNGTGVATMTLIRKQEFVPEIARACGVTRQAVFQWREVPWNRVLVVEKVTGIPRHRIRPDIYPAPRRNP